MKKAINNTKKIATGLIIIFMMGFLQAAKPADIKENPVELRFIGKYSNGPLFLLNVNNKEAGEFVIRIKDGDGNILYTEKLNGKNISRKYKVAIDAAELYEAFNVRFEITSTTTNETFIYNVTNSSHVIDDIMVARL
ncbi:MAG TPA: hypothetical protein VK498_13505 [Ferruginibacter sp.]|nr:hypothetical protein [Ferruginibacter sp.]